MRSGLWLATLCLALMLGAGSALAGWKALAPIESPRANLGAASLDGEVYVAGGRGLQGPSGAFEAFDPKANLWRPLPSMPQPLSHFGMAAAGGRIYIAGGYADAERTKPSAAVWVFDPATAGWSRAPDLPSPRASHVVVAAGGQLFVMGGEGPGAERVFALDPAKGGWRVAGGGLAAAHLDAAAAAIGRQIYVVGGRNSAAVDIYDTAAGSWRKGPALPAPRAGAAIGVIGGKIHLAGGQSLSPFKTFAEHLVLDPKGGGWSRAPDLPTPRHSIAAAVLASGWYLMGGGTGAGVFTDFTATDAVEVYQGN